MTDPRESDPRLVKLLQGVQTGSERAASELVRVYGRCILRAVRGSLNSRLREKFDSADFTQAVWASFFACPERWAGLRRPEQLIALLQRMGRNKVVDEHRRRVTQKYGVQREQRMPSWGGPDRMRSHQPTPSQLAIAREQWDRLLRTQPSRHREVLRLKAQGMTNRSVADKLGVSEKTVARVLQRLQRRPSV